ncbi:enoyl-CoA hydratase/isomerase family protein [Pseudooceanicola atlanticus]|uniref:Enoyl-CoA hydratase n=1 Tax=Pseudooceanicola atlanticus TaxID=1461694 RepID=A0A0A0EFS0_9RHOB|nr:enoyl-CoA hydratase-related protein [Pseudooceanicola atlanticus]KGM48928.1 hypothetical protein ATO9_09515 [Pseudooceanicola atlanticus]
MPRLRLTREGPVAVLTLTRPEARNAVDKAMMEEMRAALAEIEGDPALRVAVLTGEGSVFCAGMDLAGFVAGDQPGITEPDRFAGFVGSDRSKPFIAAVNGPALAGGFELMLACDLAVAVPEARFGLPEVQLGLIAAGGGAARLGAIVPPVIAAEMALTGDPIPAERALELGLLNAVVPGDALMDRALAIARRIATAAPDAVAATRRIMRAARFGGEAAGWDETDRQWATISTSDNAREGTSAFVAKRKPVFR